MHILPEDVVLTELAEIFLLPLSVLTTLIIVGLLLRRTLPRYVLTELTRWFLISLSVLTSLMIVGLLVRDGLKLGLPPEKIIYLIPFVLPDALRVAIPVTLLLATTVVYSRMAGENEVLALKAQGISPMAILWPLIFLSFALSLVTVWLNDTAVSWGRRGAQQVVIESVEDIVYGMLRREGGYSSSSFSINVTSVEEHRLINPVVWIQRHGKGEGVSVTAAEAELHTDREKGELLITVRKGKVEIQGRRQQGYRFPDVETFHIPLRDASRTDRRARRPADLPLREITVETRQQLEAIDLYEQELAARAAFQMLSGDFHALRGPEWEVESLALKGMRKRLHLLRTEPPRRWSAGFCCLFFAWVGAPMAMRRRNGEALTAFFLCFLPILAIYYPILMGMVDSAKHGTMPAAWVWAGNVLLALWGAFLLRKVLRY